LFARAKGQRPPRIPTRRSLMSTVEQSIDVDVPVRVAYDQWTQFESFPTFMDGVEEVRQIDETHLHWRAKVAGHEAEWDAVITEQIPDDFRCEGEDSAGEDTPNALVE
jgi:uncharacterized membrane protein